MQDLPRAIFELWRLEDYAERHALLTEASAAQRALQAYDKFMKAHAFGYCLCTNTFHGS